MPSPRAASLYLHAAAAVTLPLAVTLVVGWWLPWVGFGGGAVMAVALLSSWAWRLGAARLAWLPCFIGAVAAFWTAIFIVPSIQILAGAVPLVRPEDAEARLGGVTSLRDATTRIDLLGTKQWKVRSRQEDPHDVFAFVAPIVSPEWNKSSPVPAWALCVRKAYLSDGEPSLPAARDACIRELQLPTAVMLDAEVRSELQENAAPIRDALTHHGLTRRADAPVMMNAKTPETNARQQVAAFFVVVLLSAGLLVLVSRRRSG